MRTLNESPALSALASPGSGVDNRRVSRVSRRIVVRSPAIREGSVRISDQAVFDGATLYAVLMVLFMLWAGVR